MIRWVLVFFGIMFVGALIGFGGDGKSELPIGVIFWCVLGLATVIFLGDLLAGRERKVVRRKVNPEVAREQHPRLMR